MPICLPWGEGDPTCNMNQALPDKKLTLAGWGTTSLNNTYNREQVSIAETRLLLFTRKYMASSEVPICDPSCFPNNQKNPLYLTD